MKKLLAIIGSFLILLGCQNKEPKYQNLEGDLYYRSWLSFGSFYGRQDSLYTRYVALKDSIGIEELRKQDSELTAHIELLEQHKLTNSPFIYLKTDYDSTFTIYMSKKDYDPITKYSYQNLIDSEEKVRLKMDIEKLTDKLLICKKVISIEKIKGETFGKQRKFKIVEYN